MEGLRKRKWISLTLLSIVVPMSLLAAFRLTGILRGPITISETTTLETIKWEFQRPDQFVYIDDRLEPSHSSEELLATFHIGVEVYLERTATIGYDAVFMRIMINSTATSPDAFIENVYVVFHENYERSKVNWDGTEFYFDGLSLVERAEAGITEKDYAKAYIRLAGIDHPNNVYLSAIAIWKLRSPNTQNHQIEVICELTYFNGTVYKKIAQPFQLKIVGMEGE